MSNNTIIPVPYREVLATVSMRAVPRFGHTTDFSRLFSSNQAEKDDYVYGLVFVGGFVICFFLLCFLFLAICKCVGLTFLGGKRFRHPCRATIIRCVFIMATVISLSFTILLIVMGISNLQETIYTVDNSNREIMQVTLEADRIVASLQSVGQATAGVRTSLINNWSNTSFCPGNANIDSAVGVEVSAQTDQAIALLTLLNDFVSNQLTQVQSAINTTLDGSVAVDHYIQSIVIEDWQSILILTIWVIVPSSMIVGTFMAAFGVAHPYFECMLSWIFLPMLFCIVIASVVFAGFMAMIATGNADFCSGGNTSCDSLFCSGGVLDTPDQSVYAILKARGLTETDYAYQAIKFYVSQCLDEDPFSFIPNYVSQITDAQTGITSLNTSLYSVGLSNLSNLCNRDFSEIDGLLSTMATNLNTLQLSANATLALLQCETIVPIYTSTIYDGTCRYSVRGVTWAFSAFLVIAFMGMIMIMFRSSYLGNEEDYDFRDATVDGEPTNDYAYDEGYEYKYSDAQPTETYLPHIEIDEEHDHNNVSAITEHLDETIYAPAIDDEQHQESYLFDKAEEKKDF